MKYTRGCSVCRRTYKDMAKHQRASGHKGTYALTAAQKRVLNK